MKDLTNYINEQVLNEGTQFLSFSDIDKVLKPYVKTYEKMKLDAEDWEEQSIPVKTINDAIVLVGDGFYGKEKVVEFVTKSGYFGQVRKQISPGYGGSYRERINGFTISINVNNWWKKFVCTSTDDPNFKECIKLLKSLK